MGREQAIAKVKRQIAKGMEILDRKKPEYRDRVECEVLDLASPYMCVLGQTFGPDLEDAEKEAWQRDEYPNFSNPYDLGRLKLHIRNPFIYGFALAEDLQNAGIRWSDLTELWREALAAEHIDSCGTPDPEP